MSLFVKSRWYSSRVRREVTVCRWGYLGTPVLVFPTAGGDAEEIERWQMIRALIPLLKAGRIKVYSVDSVAGQTWFAQEGSVEHRMWLHEPVPGVHSLRGGARDLARLRPEQIPIWTAGASIGALFTPRPCVCRYPDVFHRAAALSGTFDILRFIHDGRDYTEDFYVSSPVHFLPGLGGYHLDELRKRFIYIASGEGRAENIGESWQLARVLGNKGGSRTGSTTGGHSPGTHDWQTWRAMLPKFLAEWTSE
jgi:esterase/lipase superfamily enzyme